MGFESIDQPRWSSEVERNPKMSILFFWLERGGGWGSGPSTNPTGHQKLNVIQKWAFYFFGWRGLVDGVRVHIPTLNWNWGGVHQPEPKCHFDLYPTISFLGGGTSVRSKMSLWPVSNFFTQGGAHRPETKCHFNLYPTFSFWGGGGSTLPANLR